MADIRKAFAGHDALSTKELIAHLIADDERQWGTYGKTGKPITDRELARLLKPFAIISTTLHRGGLADAKGYEKVRFAEAWDSYLGLTEAAAAKDQNNSEAGQNDFSERPDASQPSERPNTDGEGTSRIFASVQEAVLDGYEKGDLSNNHAGLDARTLSGGVSAAKDEIDQENGRLTTTATTGETGVCAQCKGRPDGKEQLISVIGGQSIWLHRECRKYWFDDHPAQRPSPK